MKENYLTIEDHLKRYVFCYAVKGQPGFQCDELPYGIRDDRETFLSEKADKLARMPWFA